MKKIAIVLVSGLALTMLFIVIRVMAAPLPDTTSAPLAFSWAKTWGGSSTTDYASTNRVAVDSLGNLYVVGEFQGTIDFDPDPNTTDQITSTSGSIDAFLSKFDAQGNLLWVKTWGGSKRDVAYGVGVDNVGNAYVVGPFRDTVDFNPDPAQSDVHASNAISGTIYENNIYLSKFAPDGTYQWVRTWGPALVPGKTSFGAEGYTVAVYGNSLYVVGDFSGDQTDFNPWGSHDWHQNHLPAAGPIFFDAFLSKFNLNGNFQWAKTWGGEGYDDGPGVAVDNAGNAYVAGMYASQNINFDPAGGSGGTGHPAHDSGIIVDVFLSKFDASGNFQWVKTWGGPGTDDAMGSVAIDNANNVYVAGRFASTDCNFNPDGLPADLHSTHNPAPIISPTLQQKDDALDAFLSKFDASGNFKWAKTWGGNGSDNAGVTVDQSGHVYASGWFSSTVDFDPGNGVENHVSNGKKDAFLSQFDAGGIFQWAKTWGGTGNDSSDATVDQAGDVYAGGGFVGAVDFDPDSGIDNHTANGQEGAFLSKFVSHSIYLPLIMR